MIEVQQVNIEPNNPHQTASILTKRRFYMLVGEELDLYWEKSKMPAWVYLDLWLRLENPHLDRVLPYSPKYISEQTKIPLSSVYKAIKKLKELGRITVAKSWGVQPCDNFEVSRSRQQQQTKKSQKPKKNSQQREKSKSKIINFPQKRDGSSQQRDEFSQQREKKPPKPAPEAQHGTSQTIQTNPDFFLEKEEKEFFESFWFDNEEDSRKVDEFKQEQTSQLVEAEIIEEQSETVSTSDKETFTAIVANPNLSQGKVYSACSTFETNLKHRAANPKQTNLDRLQEALNWVPDGVWCTSEEKLDPQFLNWMVKWWIAEWGGDEHQARWKVNAYFKNDLSRLPLRWEEYSRTYLAKYENANLRYSHGCKVDEKEEKELKNNIRAVVKPLPPELSCEDKALQQNPNSVALGLPEGSYNIHGKTTGCNDLAITEQKHDSSQNNDKDFRVSFVDEQNRESLLVENSAIKELDTIPTDKFGALNPQAYAYWQPKRETSPQATPEQMQALKAKITRFTGTFGSGLAEKRDKRLEITEDDRLTNAERTLKRINQDLQDSILRESAVIKAKKLGYDLIRNENGIVIAAELPF